MIFKRSDGKWYRWDGVKWSKPLTAKQIAEAKL